MDVPTNTPDTSDARTPDARTPAPKPAHKATMKAWDLPDVPARERGHQHLWAGSGGTIDVTIHVRNDQPLSTGFVTLNDNADRCYWCDAYPRFAYDGTHVVATTDCPYPNGLDITFDLVVTSGRIVVTDDLRPIYEVGEVPGPGYNSMIGQANYCQAMSTIGCAYGPVGNSSPSLIRTGPDTYTIATGGKRKNTDSPTTKVLATITTDLHAYSIADRNDYRAKTAAWLANGGDPERLPTGITVVDMPNGTYRFDHHTASAGFDRDEWPTTYATITKIA